MKAFQTSVLSCGAAVLVAFGDLPASASEVLSVSIGADWAINGITPWQNGVTEATVVMRDVFSRANVTTGHFLVGQFSGGIWEPLDVTGITRTSKPGLGIVTFTITFDAVVAKTVLLVVVAGPTTGLTTPFSFEFGNLTGDVSGDGVVTPLDSLMVIEHINSPPDPESMVEYDPRYDINRDGVVSAIDFAIVLAVINASPEPPSIVRTEALPPPTSTHPTFDVHVELPIARAVLTLHNLTFGFEYPIQTSTNLHSWLARPPVIASTSFGALPAERTYPLTKEGREFFRVLWPNDAK